MQRREFLGLATASVSLPLVITACSRKSTARVASSPRADGFQTVGTLTDLDQHGSILATLVADRAVLVIRNPDNPKMLMAVNPTCTHEGCTVGWQSDQNAFVCPCHNAKFSRQGSVLQGPAQQPLGTYAVRLEGNSILVKTA
jgi:cytochrome b6-f complex iron-sulfur subunit